MKKKSYQQPRAEFIEIGTNEIIAASSASLSNRSSVDYNSGNTNNRNGWEGLWTKE